MPAWPGGPCPNCGDIMPKNLVHCQRCRTLLNSDLKESRVAHPGYFPLQEVSRMIDVVPAGFYIACPECTRELRVSRKYTGARVQCKLCAAPFRLDYENSGLIRSAFFARCPHCSEEIRASQKYIGRDVSCKHCGGPIRFVPS